MASADFDTQDFDLNDIAFDSTIAVSDHDWKEDHSNLDGFFVFGFTNQNTGQPFCHAFPLNGMGSNWDYNHFYEYSLLRRASRVCSEAPLRIEVF